MGLLFWGKGDKLKDYYIRAIDKSGKIRIFIATSTNIVEKARKIHKTSPTASAALGRALTAGALMGAMMKNEKDTLTLRILGDGPAGGILIVSRNKGKVKGDMSNPRADLPSREDGKLDVGGLVGKNGIMTVTMDLGLKEPYVGQSNLVTGEIAEDIVHYYINSEQQPSAVSLGVLVDKDISIKAAGGYIIQLLPQVSEEDVERIEKTLSKIDPVSALINKGLTPEEILDEILGDFSMEILEKEEIQYKCDCSRGKVEKTIRSLGKIEVQNIIDEDGQAEIVCHFCNTKYQFDKADLEKILVSIVSENVT